MENLSISYTLILYVTPSRFSFRKKAQSKPARKRRKGSKNVNLLTLPIVYKSHYFCDYIE